MRILVTGSAGHLGEALVRTIQSTGDEAIGIDILDSEFTHKVGSIIDREFVRHCIATTDAVIHTATLHKPHVASHARQAFIDTNITGTLNLLEEAAHAGIRRFVFTSTTSAFGAALVPPEGAPAAWITEDVQPVPKNIYGVTKTAAEDLCQLFHRKQGLPCIVLRTSRFFPEEDDGEEIREMFASDNAKANEFLFRRIDLEDAVSAHLCAVERAPEIGFRRYIISATSPFERRDLVGLRTDAAAVVCQRAPQFEALYQRLGWRMFATIDRVYVNQKARDQLGWRPKYDFARVIDQLGRGEAMGSELARTVGSKGYHSEDFAEGPYPVD
ncbi:MAG: NAD(P)-dependent oxidoreductase [Proteobacteria bacterium]|nr:NAD(P)-dependent oxidoreductase [Pseudomonadota bacterium]MDA1357442.1 NAD(P)-dependent oxidoreductase [Pseudomonadota bacterium]